MKGIIASYIFFKVRYSTALHSCVLPGQWPPLLFVANPFGCLTVPCCCGPLPMALLNHSNVSVRVMTESRGA